MIGPSARRFVKPGRQNGQVLEHGGVLSGSARGKSRHAAQPGPRAAADAIRRLGLNAAELLALPLDRRIAQVTEAIRLNAAASEQAALFSQFFGDRAFVLTIVGACIRT